MEPLRLFDPPVESLPGGRLSIEPLIVAMGGIDATAEVIGRSRAAVYRMREFGISYAQADEFAIGGGTHPCVLWPEWGDAP